MKKRKSSAVNKDHYGYIFIAPFIIVFVTFILYPIFNTFRLSLTDANLMTGFQGDFVGIDNFTRLLNETMFRRAAFNTWMLWLFNFIPQMILALVLAAIFSNSTIKIRGKGLFKVMYYLPNLLMPVTVAAMFSAYLAVHGPLNQLLVGATGLMAEPRNFLGSPFDTRVAVIFIQTWMWFGQTAIVLVAGMTSISPTYYESAMIDGAGQRKMFFHITLPLIKPILLFVLVTSLVGGLQMFEIPRMLTNAFGAPDHSILTMNMFMDLRRGFPAGAIGSAASISVVLFFMSSFVALILFKLLGERSEEEELRRLEKKRRKSFSVKEQGGAK